MIWNWKWKKKLFLISSKYSYFKLVFNYIKKGLWKGTLICRNCDTLMCFCPFQTLIIFHFLLLISVANRVCLNELFMVCNLLDWMFLLEKEHHNVCSFSDSWISYVLDFNGMWLCDTKACNKNWPIEFMHGLCQCKDSINDLGNYL
jgi:hypothetical protein